MQGVTNGSLHNCFSAPVRVIAKKGYPEIIQEAVGRYVVIWVQRVHQRLKIIAVTFDRVASPLDQDRIVVRRIEIAIGVNDLRPHLAAISTHIGFQ